MRCDRLMGRGSVRCCRYAAGRLPAWWSYYTAGGREERDLASLDNVTEIKPDGHYPGVGQFAVQMGTLLTVLGTLLADSFVTALGVGCLTFAAVAWGWARFSLAGVRFQRRLSERRAFPGETVTLTLTVDNRKLLPQSWLQVADTLSGRIAIDGAPVAVDPATHQGRFVTLWQPGAYQTQQRRYTLRCDHRGIHTFGPAEVTTGDGLGFFRRRWRLEACERLIVYPRLYPAEAVHLPSHYPFGTQVADRRLIEDPLHTAGAREWYPGDPLRRVHWKATARHQRLLSRQFETGREPQVLIALNVATLERHWEGVVQELLERAISVAASLAVQCSEQKLPVGLIANAYWPGSDQLLRSMPGRSPAHLPRLLEMLASITGHAHRPLEEMLLRDAGGLPWGASLLVVTPVAHDSLLRALLALKKQGLRVALFTLAEEPPAHVLPGVPVYHLPHLVADLIAPERLAG